MRKSIACLSPILIAAVFLLCRPAILLAGTWDAVSAMVGNQDSVLVADENGKILFAKNADKKRIPASIFKYLTALATKHYLGEDFRFVTEFYTDKEQNLKIKGYGDPLLISEVLPDIAAALHAQIREINNILPDDSYFDPVVIPGVTTTLNPFDSPNGALCVNFNTVNFRKVNGNYESAEPQTPLVPFIREKVGRTGLKEGRIVLSAENQVIPLYAGHLFRYFLEKEGIKIGGQVKMGRVNPDTDKRIYTYRSVYSLDEIITRLMEYSNNFTANQLLIACGIRAFGPPGTLKKAVSAGMNYAQTVLKLKSLEMEEGSGISPNNRITPFDMLTILQKFEPHMKLLRHEGRQYFKTGSLTGVKTRAGYIESSNGKFYRFVVMVNTPAKTTDRIMEKIVNIIQ
jgi:D-alanyl-D-alanine carboxypeptidase/D-alanyl-D-alanine-endopeptidase (penicillin-binding protein 4)